MKAGRKRPAFFRFGSSLGANGWAVSDAQQFSTDFRGAAFVTEPLCLGDVGPPTIHSRRKGLPMRKLFLAGAAAMVVAATPAAAADGSGYIGLEGGVLFPKDQDVDLNVDYTTTNATVPAGGTLPTGIPAGPASTTFDNAFGVDYKTGFDIDLIGGYDFGMFRVEGELGYKKANAAALEIDDTDLAALNAALNRPAGTGDPGAPGLPAIGSTDLDL